MYVITGEMNLIFRMKSSRCLLKKLKKFYTTNDGVCCVMICMRESTYCSEL